MLSSVLQYQEFLKLTKNIFKIVKYVKMRLFTCNAGLIISTTLPCLSWKLALETLPVSPSCATWFWRKLKTRKKLLTRKIYKIIEYMSKIELNMLAKKNRVKFTQRISWGLYVDLHLRVSSSIFLAFSTFQLRAAKYLLKEASEQNTKLCPESGSIADLNSLTWNFIGVRLLKLY